MPLQRRLPKRGFHNIFRKHREIVNLGSLAIFDPGATVGIEDLVSRGLVRRGFPVKLLAKGELNHKLSLVVNSASKVAMQSIENLGGQVDIQPFKQGAAKRRESAKSMTEPLSDI
jgi:large subunit ribosomal protein L15